MRTVSISARKRTGVVASLLAAVVISGVLVSPPAGAAQPSAPVHAWNANLHQFRDAWEGFVARMVVSGTPDVITLQDVNHCFVSGNNSRSTMGGFMAELRRLFPLNTWSYRHTDGMSCGSGSAVVWNDDRFVITGQNMGVADACSYGNPALVALRERSNNNTLTVASVHIHRNSQCGITNVLNSINNGLEGLASKRHISLIMGDFNTRPDHDGETVLHGLETAPDCWYTGFSALHTGCSVAGDRYYDSVWLKPQGGAGVNPAATSLCQQYTRVFPIDTNIAPHDAGNSCTDLDMDGQLDRNRIDYIWPSWEYETGQPYRPNLATAQLMIEYASADTGMSLTAPDRYSDHRAVEAIVAWPPAVDLPL